MSDNTVNTVTISAWAFWPILGTTILSLLHFVGKTWFKAWADHKYNLKIIELQHRTEVRLRSEIVAELMALWIANPPDQYELNRLTFQAFLWLPKELAEKLSKILAHTEGKDSLRTLIKDIRTYLNNNEDDGFDPNKVIVFHKKPAD